MSKRKLLLADDSKTIQKVVNLTFAGEAIEVITAGDGDAAMEKFTEAQPDLVLADVNLPGLSGYEFCERIKRDEATKKTPVILLVGSFEPFDKAEAKRVGAEDFLTKPFQSIRQLIEKVSDLLNGNGGEETLNYTTNFGAETENSPEKVNDSAEGFDSDSSDARAAADEMILTSQIGSLPIDEAQKFNASFISEPLEEDNFEPTEKSFDAEFSDLRMFEADGNSADKTLSSDREGFNENLSAVAVDAAADEKVYEFADNQISVDTNRETRKFSANDLDEMDLLEIPPLENLARDGYFSPELIEAVAQKVIERLSDRSVREIAAEIVPPIAESIIRQIAEQRLEDEK